MPNSYDFGKRIVEDLYQMEKDADFNDALTQSVSFKVSVDTASLLAVIADRFGQSRHAFGGDILDDVALSIFAHLTPEDRLTIGQKADDLTTDYMLKKGYTSESFGIQGAQQNRFGKWETMADYNEDPSLTTKFKGAE